MAWSKRPNPQKRFSKSFCYLGALLYHIPASSQLTELVTSWQCCIYCLAHLCHCCLSVTAPQIHPGAPRDPRTGQGFLGVIPCSRAGAAGLWAQPAFLTPARWRQRFCFIFSHSPTSNLQRHRITSGCSSQLIWGTGEPGCADGVNKPVRSMSGFVQPGITSLLWVEASHLLLLG